MSDVWSFGPSHDSETNYATGDIVPHRGWVVLLNGVVVGECDVHMHKRRGPDGKVDTSFGFTGTVYSQPQGGR